MVNSHTHGDHWGGVRGLLAEEVRTHDVAIIAPRDFMRLLIEENVCAGTAMSRRLGDQYGQRLTVAPHGFVTQGLGHGISAGSALVRSRCRSAAGSATRSMRRTR